MSQIGQIIKAEIQPLNCQELFERFLRLSVANGDASRHTLNSYREGLACYFGWCRFQDLPPESCTFDNIEAYRKWLISKGYKKGTIELRLLAVRVLYKALQRWGMRADNPALGVKAPRELTPANLGILRKALSSEEARKLLESLPSGRGAVSARDRALIMTMLFQGLRVSEVADLRLVDLDTAEFNYLEVLGKGEKSRRSYLSGPPRGAIIQWLDYRGLDTPTQALFCRLDVPGNPHLTTRSIQRITDFYLRRSGLKQAGRSAHALRHTFAIMSLIGGAQREAIAEAMGHSDIRTTDVYLRAAACFQSNPAEAVVKAIQKEVNQHGL